MNSKKVVVTGGSGGLGQAVVETLLDAGYKVLSLDRRPHPSGHKPSWTVDLLNAGDLYEACKNSWAIVHLAAHIAPNLASDVNTFNDNVCMTYNVLKAATDMGVKHAVMASSTAVYGFLYGLHGETPDYLPADERHPMGPVDPYGLSKVVGERVADSFAKKEGMSICSLRFPGINYDEKYERVRRLTSDPAFRAPGFWSYIDVRDAARAVLLALEKGLPGHHAYNVACSSSNMRESTSELAKRFFPGLTDVRMSPEGNWSGIDSSAAAKELGFVSSFRWEDAALDHQNAGSR